MTTCCTLLAAALALGAPSETPAAPSEAPASADSVVDAPATSTARGVELTLAYYGPYFVQPGVKLGARVPLRTWASRRTAPSGAPRKLRTLFIAPQLGFFARPAQHFDVIVNAALGYQALRPKHGLYVAPSIGVAYYVAAQQVALAVDLATGDQTPTRELRHHVLPTLSYAFGQRLRPRSGPPVGWFVELSYGHSFSPSVASALWLAFELGVSIELGPRGGKDRA